VITARDVDCIYEVPLELAAEGLDNLIVEYLRLPVHDRNMTRWRRLIERLRNPRGEVRIAIVGKYVQYRDAYKSLSEALSHGGLANDLHTELDWVDAERLLEEDPADVLADHDGILVPGGFGVRGIEGKIAAIRYAREAGVPFFGICLGMQCAVIEFARSRCGLEGANSAEFDADTPHPVIHILPHLAGEKDMGGTLRLGAYPCVLKRNTRSRAAYGRDRIDERHRHRYEVNNDYLEQLEAAGMVVSGRSPDGRLVEMVEIPEHPWFVACQFHPEFKSRPLEPHPLFREFTRAAWERRRAREESANHAGG